MFDAKNALRVLKSKFQDDLAQNIADRDLSSEKVKNASILRIKVPKYHGYGSSVDFYTFKSEFEKLISPNIQKKLLPEYLKNNYLEGQALEIDEIDKIWKRLQTSFGNVNILLNDKLSEIISGPLWKVKNDEKLIQMMTKLINGMKELIKLAEKHGIEEALFHQSNLVKIYDLIGKGRQIRFVEQNIDKEMTLKQEWQNFIDFLHRELRSKEKLLMCEKFKLENNNR